MPGIYLRCDTCGTTFERANPKDEPFHWSRFYSLQAEARAEGWTGPLTRDSDSDKCPACSRGVAVLNNA